MTVEEAISEFGELEDFRKENKGDTIFWTYPINQKGPLLFSFDKKHIYNYWPDFPFNLTDEEVKIFCKDSPYWANFRRQEVEARGIDVDQFLKKK